MELTTRRILRIFDSDAISTDLEVGKSYELLLYLSTDYDYVRYFNQPPIVDESIARLEAPNDYNEYTMFYWGGVIVNPTWYANEIASYRRVVAGTYKRNWLLLNTAFGYVLGENNYNFPIAVGAYLEFGYTAVFLQAIL